MKIIVLLAVVFLLSLLQSYAWGECDGEYQNQYSIIMASNESSQLNKSAFIELGLTNFSCVNTDCTDMDIKDSFYGNSLLFQIFNESNTTKNKKMQRTV